MSMKNSGECLRAALVALDHQASKSEAHSKAAPAPWLFTHDGREWALSSDGWSMVWVRRELVPGELPQPYKGAYDLAVNWIDRSVDAQMVIPSAELCAFVRVGKPLATCPDCNGKQWIACDECEDGWIDCECGRCGDTHSRQCKSCSEGERRCQCYSPNEPCELLGGVVDLLRLRDVLSIVQPEGRVSISYLDYPQATRKGTRIYLVRPLDDEDWLALVMPMSPQVQPKLKFTPALAVAAQAEGRAS